jgi:hypothetical protein
MIQGGEGGSLVYSVPWFLFTMSLTRYVINILLKISVLFLHYTTKYKHFYSAIYNSVDAKHDGKWRQYVPLKCFYLYTSPHDITTLKTMINIFKAGVPQIALTSTVYNIYTIAQ